MSTRIIVSILILLYIFTLTHSDTTENEMLNGTEKNKILKLMEAKHAPHGGNKYAFLFSGIVIVAIIRYAAGAYEVPLSYAVFCIIIGMLWGIGSLYNNNMSELSGMSSNTVRDLNIVYLPALIFTTVFCIDFHGFVKSIGQILIIGIFVCFISAIATGFLMKLVINKGWSDADAVLFGLILAPIFPIGVFYWLKGTNLQMKYVKILLEGEILVSCSAVNTAVGLITSYLDDWVIHWYQFVLGAVRAFGLVVMSNYENGFHDTSSSYLIGKKYVFMSSLILIICIIRYLTRLSQISVPYSVFSILLSMLWGIGALYNNWMKEFADLATASVKQLHFIYLPVIIFSTAFVIDVQLFLKCLPQILIIVGPGEILLISSAKILVATLIGTTSFAAIMDMVIDANWTDVDALLFGTISSSIYPPNIIRWLEECTAITKHAIILLEGETLIAAALSYITFVIVHSFIMKWSIRWYQFVACFLRIFFLGVPVSYLYGLLGASLMKLAYNDSPGLMILTVGMCYSTYYVIKWLANAGIVATAVVGLIMGLERASLSKDMEKTVIDLWKMITSIINSILFINIGVLTPRLLNDLAFHDYILVFVTYLITNITRFISFFLFSPILSRIGYGMTFQNMIIIVWGGLKNPICLNMALDLYDGTYRDDPEKAKIFFLHTVAVYMLMLFINGSCVPILMKALGLSEISVSRQVNMNNCMKYIYEARARTVAILKMDRFLSDANWPLVMNATTLKHPYKKVISLDTPGNEEEEEEDEYFLGYKSTYCPDCQKNIPNEPTPKELKEMTKEAKLRLLKLKKSAFSRQYENGMISKEGIRVLHQAVEIAMDSEELVIELDGLFKLFNKEGMFYRFLRNRLQYFAIAKNEEYKPPRKHERLMCYRIVYHMAFNLFMSLLVALNVVLIAIHMVYRIGDEDDIKLCFFFGFWFFYFAEFWMKIFALSWIYICENGFYYYFTNYWYVQEFIAMVLSFIASVLNALDKQVSADTVLVADYLLIIFLSIRSFYIFIAIMKLCPFCQTLTDSMIKFLDAKVDRHRALAYELGKNYIAAEEEILENLQQIVDNDKIRESIKTKIENDKLAVMKRLGLAQKESPGVAITVKTKLAMRTVLSSMKDDVQELKVSGWVDDVEYNRLLKSLGERYKYISSIKTIEPSSPKLIFREISYMGDDDELTEFLYTNITTKKFDPGDIVIKEGELIEGIYILITGMFMITFTPRSEVTEKLREVGVLPIVDYIVSLSYEEKLSEYIIPGNTIGELCILTDRSYSGTITAETHSQVYILNRAIMEKAFSMDDDPVTGLQCRIWKYIGFRKALTVMMNTPSYRTYTQERIKFILERSFVPDLSNYKVFVVNDMMEDIILIEGVAVDFNTRDIYTGPCYIPRAVQKLVLPKSSFVNIDVQIETKLLIIPAKDYNEYEIMVTEEDVCELVNNDSSRCLRHIIQEKAPTSAKASKATKQMKGIISGLKKRLMGVDSNKSRITDFSVTSKTSSKVKQ